MFTFGCAPRHVVEPRRAESPGPYQDIRKSLQKIGHSERAGTRRESTGVGDHDIKSTSNLLDFCNRSIISGSVAGDECDDMDPSRISFGQSVQVLSGLWVARTCEYNHVVACGKLFDELKAYEIGLVVDITHAKLTYAAVRSGDKVYGRGGHYLCRLE